jgi:hypothetical protein
VTFQSRTFARFWQRYDELSPEMQRQADKQYALFRENPLQPSLRLKAVGPFWSVRVSGSHRALALRKGDVFHWFWIGPHDEYEAILKRSK